MIFQIVSSANGIEQKMDYITTEYCSAQVGIKVEIVSLTGRRADCSLPFNGKVDLALMVLGYDINDKSRPDA